MVALVHGKSKAWRLEHCSMCEKKFKRTEPRVNGTAIFEGEEKVIKVMYHEKCCRDAEYQYACEQLIKESTGEIE